MKDLNKMIYILITIFVLAMSYVYAAAGNPTGATGITKGENEVLNASNWGGYEFFAQAGNVTEINITGTSQTVSWQGYYGEITGTITLDDAQNNTMYDWSALEPQGEIYAANHSTIDWVQIQCINYTRAQDVTNGYTGPNLTTLEGFYNMNYTNNDGKDGFDETFNASGDLDGVTPHSSFYVGPKQIGAGACPATDTYESDSSTGTEFQEVLLTDNSSLIFVTIIENDVFGNGTAVTGFDGATHDFQMLVAEDGHNDDTVATAYYFYVELE